MGFISSYRLIWSPACSQQRASSGQVDLDGSQSAHQMATSVGHRILNWVGRQGHGFPLATFMRYVVLLGRQSQVCVGFSRGCIRQWEGSLGVR